MIKYPVDWEQNLTRYKANLSPIIIFLILNQFLKMLKSCYADLINPIENHFLLPRMLSQFARYDANNKIHIIKL